MHTLWPLAPDRTRIVCDWLVHPDETATSGLHPADRRDVLGHDEPAGLARVRAGAGRHQLTGGQPGPYSNREELLFAFDQMIVGLHE